MSTEGLSKSSTGYTPILYSKRTKQYADDPDFWPHQVVRHIDGAVFTVGDDVCLNMSENERELLGRIVNISPVGNSIHVQPHDSGPIPNVLWVVKIEKLYHRGPTPEPMPTPDPMPKKSLADKVLDEWDEPLDKPIAFKSRYNFGQKVIVKFNPEESGFIATISGIRFYPGKVNYNLDVFVGPNKTQVTTIDNVDSCFIHDR